MVKYARWWSMRKTPLLTTLVLSPSVFNNPWHWHAGNVNFHPPCGTEQQISTTMVLTLTLTPIAEYTEFLYLCANFVNIFWTKNYCLHEQLEPWIWQQWALAVSLLLMFWKWLGLFIIPNAAVMLAVPLWTALEGPVERSQHLVRPRKRERSARQSGVKPKAKR